MQRHGMRTRCEKKGKNQKPPEGGFRNRLRFNGFFGEPSWDRTNDPLIKSQMLCQLSYGLPPELVILRSGSRKCQARKGFLRMIVWFRSGPTETRETSTEVTSSIIWTYFRAAFGRSPNSLAEEMSSFQPSTCS